MEFNAKKCSLVDFGENARTTKGNHYLGNEEIIERTEEKNLGVSIPNKLVWQAYKQNRKRNIQSAKKCQDDVYLDWWEFDNNKKKR